MLLLFGGGGGGGGRGTTPFSLFFFFFNCYYCINGICSINTLYAAVDHLRQKRNQEQLFQFFYYIGGCSKLVNDPFKMNLNFVRFWTE